MKREIGALEEIGRFLTAKLGVRIEEDRAAELAALVAERARKRSVRRTPEYLDILRTDETELSAVVDRFMVGETHFFRQIDHFEALVDTVLPQAVRRARRQARPVRLLSAGCATGEEAYSLAMVTRDALGGKSVPSCEILGVDICTRFLAQARGGKYRQWSLRSTPADMLERYFDVRAGSVTLRKEAFEPVTFRRFNLTAESAETEDLWQPGCYDAIFLRNVIMYFTPEVSRAVIARATRALTPDGFLFLGHAETLRGISDRYHLLQHGDSFFYQRKDESMAGRLTAQNDGHDSRTESPKTPLELFVPNRQAGSAVHSTKSETDWVENVRTAARKIERLSARARKAQPIGERYGCEGIGSSNAVATNSSATREAMHLFLGKRHQQALALLRGLPEKAAVDPDVLTLEAVVLLDMGSVDAARRVCEALTRADELHASGRYLQALCCERLGDEDGAIREHRAALYLEPQSALPHLHLGLLYKERGELKAAIRELKQAKELLVREDATRILLFGDGLTRRALECLCDNALDELLEMKR